MVAANILSHQCISNQNDILPRQVAKCAKPLGASQYCPVTYWISIQNSLILYIPHTFKQQQNTFFCMGNRTGERFFLLHVPFREKGFNVTHCTQLRTHYSVWLCMIGVSFICVKLNCYEVLKIMIHNRNTIWRMKGQPG